MKYPLNGFAKPQRKFAHRLRALQAGLLSILILGLFPALEADDSKQIHDLAPFEVDSLWVDNDLTPAHPTKVVSPALTKYVRGTEITMTFIIDRRGNTSYIRSDANPFDPKTKSLEALMQDALSHWEFKPAHDENGKAVAVKVALPVKVVSQKSEDSRMYASLRVQKPVLLAVLDR